MEVIMHNEEQYDLIKQVVKAAAKNGIKLSSQTIGDVLNDNGSEIRGSTQGARNRGISKKIAAAFNRSDDEGKQDFYDVIK